MTPSLIIRWLPALTLFLAIAAQELALPVRGWAVLRPDLLLVCLFYWRLYRPDRCGAGMAFAAGLVVDVAAGMPLGVNAFTKPLITLVVGSFGNRLRAADFLFHLPIVLLLTLLEQGVQWTLISVIQGPETRWPLVLGKPVATLLMTPLVVAMLIRIHRAWLEEG